MESSVISASEVHPPAFRSATAWLIFLVTAGAGLFADLWTKHLAFSRLASFRTLDDGRAVLDGSATYKAVPGWLHFHVTTNHGAVFGVGQGQRTLFLVVSLAAIGFIVSLFASSDRRRFYQFLLGLLLAGVLGNLYDRMVFGYVRDMIHALPDQHWPGKWAIPWINYPGEGRDVFPWIFNVADTFLCTGVGLMILYSFIHPHPSKAAQAEEPAAA